VGPNDRASKLWRTLSKKEDGSSRFSFGRSGSGRREGDEAATSAAAGDNKTLQMTDDWLKSNKY
jgi:hypothetical protein